MGKCLVKGTLVPTTTGHRCIEDISIGEYVFTPEGNPTRVKGTYSNGIQDIYKVCFDSGEEILCDKDHIWYVEPPLSCVTARKERFEWKCGKLKTTEELLTSSDTWFIPLPRAVEFDTKILPIDPYILGYWLGNGASDEGCIYVCNGDEYLFEGVYSSTRQQVGCSRLHISGIIGLIKELGLYKNKHIPSIYKNSSVEQRIALLQGLMDSDGSALGTSGTCRFDNKNERLISDFFELACGLGLKPFKHVYLRGEEKEYYCLFRGRTFPVFRLNRKNEKVLYSGRPIRRKIIKIEKLEYQEEVFCISIEDSKNLFLCTESYIPTHNTVCCINEAIDQALHCELRNPHYAYIAPTYSQAEKIAWEYFKNYCENIPGYKANEAKLRITIVRKDKKDAITFWLLGAENPESIKGIYLDGAILDEYGKMNPVIWTQVIRQCLSDRMGWAIFIGTPLGRNQFYERYLYALAHPENWFAIMFKASETGIIPPSELKDMKEEMTEDEFSQELECSFTAALTGMYYSKEMLKLREDGRIGDVPHNPRLPVSTFWDLGVADDMVVWFVQYDGVNYNVIRYMEEAGKSIAWWIKELTTLPYNYARHHWPHDGSQRELVSGKERWITAEELGLKPIDIVNRVRIKGDAIDASRSILPLCRFDEKNCESGIYCLENYQREWDNKNKVFKINPKHDWASHGADGFSTFAVGVDPRLSFSKETVYNNLSTFAKSDYDEFE